MTFFAAAGAFLGTAGGAAALTAGGAIAGGLIASNGAQDAADTQAGAARDATEAQRQMFERQIALQEPWRQAGGVGLNALLYGLGLSPGGTFTPGAAPSGPAMLQPGADGVFAPAGGETAAQIRARLAPQFTTTDDGMRFVPNDETGGQWVQGGSTVNEAGLAAAVQQAIQHQQGAQAAQAPTVPAVQPAAGAANPAAAGGPGYGALMHDFGTADFQADPGYAFRLAEGERALQRGKSASGSLGSGGYLKDLTDYSQGMASQEFGNANARYNANRGFKLNALQALSGTGQSATNQMGAAAGAFGSQIGDNIIGAGNTRAAGQVGSASAINGAIGSGLSMYQQQQMINRQPNWNALLQGGGYGFSPYGTGPASFGDFPFIPTA
jgi:hypothetical protein